MIPIRKFALVVFNGLDEEVDRFDLDYVETPKNLGFSLSLTKIETGSTDYVTSVKNGKEAVSLTLNFIPPNAYQKATAFRVFVQQHLKETTVLEYNDTIKNYYWAGKITKFGQEELTEWGGLVCPVSFTPTSPKFFPVKNDIAIIPSGVGKSYRIQYPYSYEESLVENDTLTNTYFDDIPLQVFVYGKILDPMIGLVGEDGVTYSRVRFENLIVHEGEHLLIDAVNSKVLLWRNGAYRSVYDYLDKGPTFDSFLYARGSSTTKIAMNLSTGDTPFLVASYRQYTL